MKDIYEGAETTRRSLLAGTVGAASMLAIPWLRRAGAQSRRLSEAEQREKVEAAIPTGAFATPDRPRRLLIFDLNVNYGGHASIPTANMAFTMMGARTGAFETEISRDPAVFAPGSLKRFDAVFFNNTVGNCFEDPALRQSLVEFVYAGGGLMGVHGTSVAFTKWPGAIEDWPEFGIMLGARGANHKANDEHVFIKLDDPAHPIVQPFGGDFDYRDEFFRVHEPYSRNRVRVLLSIDTGRTDMNQKPAYGKVLRDDNDYALAWVRQYGRGRVFYCGFAHHPAVFWDPKMLQFYLAATQFALGDLSGPTTPSARLTRAIRAREQLGWRLGLVPSAPDGLTLFETIDKAAELGLLYVGASSRQMVSDSIPKAINERLNGEDRRRIRLKLDEAGVRLLTYQIDRVPSDEGRRRDLVAFAWKMGVEAVTAERASGILKRLCDEHDIRFVTSSSDERGIVPLGHLNEERLAATLERIHRMNAVPVMFGIEFPRGEAASTSSIAQTIGLFGKVSLQIAKRSKS